MLWYIKRIAVFVILQEIILGMVINEEYKKIIKLVMGFIMIIFVLSPLSEITGFSAKIKEGIVKYENQFESSKIEEKINQKSIENVVKSYEKKIEDEMRNVFLEYGYELMGVEAIVKAYGEEYIFEGVNIKTDKKIKENSPSYIAIKNEFVEKVGVPYEKIYFE